MSKKTLTLFFISLAAFAVTFQNCSIQDPGFNLKESVSNTSQNDSNPPP